MQNPKKNNLTFKGAFVFFLATAIINLIFNPLLQSFGMDVRLSAFLVNTLGISGSLSYVLLKVNRVASTTKQAGWWIAGITAATALICYATIYLQL
ncbi:MAG: hypothetical protein FWF59_06060 [Turicibacter sp.]|nr:hypothetical protein [Turicibacter sp.]